ITAAVSSRPPRTPMMLPMASMVTVKPSSRIHRTSRSRPARSSSESASRQLPPPGSAPIALRASSRRSNLGKLIESVGAMQEIRAVGGLTGRHDSGALPRGNVAGNGMNAELTAIRQGEPATVAAAIAILGLATIAGFLFFQYGVGLPPCPLCLEQRYAFYLGVPLAALLWLG